MRGDSDRVLAYVKELRRRGVSAVITLYAIRDLKGAERADVLRVGRQHSTQITQIDRGGTRISFLGFLEPPINSKLSAPICDSSALICVEFGGAHLC
jgi:hypothetical protein